MAGKSKSAWLAANPLRRIAVVGGGPKAVALAVKAHVLRSLRLQNTEVVIFEKTAVGSAWAGHEGYTDGQQLLCTRPERDLGFPYRSMYGLSADARMRSYSWAQFLTGQREAYSAWVDRGRKPPKHEQFADYLRWALKRVNNKPLIAEVTELRDVGGQWEVDYRMTATGAVHTQTFDGVVMTGPGPANPLPVLDGAGNPATDPRIFNGHDFWNRRADIDALIPTLGAAVANGYDTDILIIGGGGTAAATLAWLLSHGCMDHAIQVVATRAVLHTRVDSMFENKLFSEEDIWSTLSPASQDDLFNRLNRGVVWETVIDKVSAAENLAIRDGKVTSIHVRTLGGQQQMFVDVLQGNGVTITIQPNVLVDATGFNARWFKSLIPQWPAAVTDKTLEDALTAELHYDSAAGWLLPRLHVPTLSARVGPGFASLMVLGGMSDRILRAYK